MSLLPPDPRQRKAFDGDEIIFTIGNKGFAIYPAHLDHHAIVQEVELTYNIRRGTPRARYRVACECGLELHPRSDAFERV